MTGLYVHVPFCAKKCPYCDFYSERLNADKAHRYADAVIRNIKYYNEEYDTVYIGGGTPVLLHRELCRILPYINAEKNAEITVEANPNAVNRDILLSLKSAGVNRVSFGVQSLSPTELSALGRKHTREQAMDAIRLAAEIGFTNISADLMLAIPQQTEETLSETIEALCSLPITHISAYILKIEPKTPFGENPPTVPDEDETDALYLFAVKKLSEHGFSQYEISNFAKKGYQSRHNLKYWKSSDYIGIGPAAHSCYKGKRFEVPRDLDGFIGSERQNEVINEDNPHDFFEYAMLKLRLTEGLLFSELSEFGIDREKLLKNACLVPSEYVSVSANGISLTPRGFLVSNAVIVKLLT